MREIFVAISNGWRKCRLNDTKRIRYNKIQFGAEYSSITNKRVKSSENSHFS